MGGTAVARSALVIAEIGLRPGRAALLLAAELGGVLALRGITIRQYVAERDPVSGAVYLVTLAVFALMPLLVARS